MNELDWIWTLGHCDISIFQFDACLPFIFVPIHPLKLVARHIKNGDEQIPLGNWELPRGSNLSSSLFARKWPQSPQYCAVNATMENEKIPEFFSHFLCGAFLLLFANIYKEISM